MKIEEGSQIRISSDYGYHLDLFDTLIVKEIDEDRGIIKCDDGFELMIE